MCLIKKEEAEDLSQKRILIVDDQSYNIDVIKIILQSAFKMDTDLLCASAFNGKQAVEKVLKSIEFYNGVKCGYDLILMDCNMPFMDGYDATVQIREQITELKLDQPTIAAVTGHAEAHYVKRCFDSGMDKVFSKPIEIKNLKELL